jgi:hypothetical protein
MTREDDKLIAAVLRELAEMKALGIRVPRKAFSLARDLKADEYYESAKVSAIADLVIRHAEID